jgi:hypothetical protein
VTCEFQLVSSHHGSHSPHAFFSRSQPRVQLISLFGLFSRGQSVQVGSEGQCSWGLAVSNLHLNIIVINIITSSRPVRVDQGWHALRVQNHGWMVVGIVIVDSVGRASVRLFRVCVPHGTFGDMNGEYRSPGPATRRTAAGRRRASFRPRSEGSPTENLNQDPSHVGGPGDHLECGWDALELDAGTTPGIFSRNPNA